MKKAQRDRDREVRKAQKGSEAAQNSISSIVKEAKRKATKAEGA